jgi:hypothetical protein
MMRLIARVAKSDKCLAGTLAGAFAGLLGAGGRRGGGDRSLPEPIRTDAPLGDRCRCLPIWRRRARGWGLRWIGRVLP